MIVSIGEASLAFGKCTSKALYTAWKLAQMGLSVMFVGPVPDNEQGMETLEFLIDNCIFFDPAFCKQDSFSREKLEDVFTTNDDVNVVVLSGDFLDNSKNVEMLYSVLSTKKGVKIYLNAVGKPALLGTKLAELCCRVRTEEENDEDYDARVAAGLQNGTEEV